MYESTLSETKVSSKTKEKSHLIEQLNLQRVKEFTNVSRLVLAQGRMLKKSSLAQAKNSMLKFSKRLKY